MAGINSMHTQSGFYTGFFLLEGGRCRNVPKLGGSGGMLPQNFQPPRLFLVAFETTCTS